MEKTYEQHIEDEIADRELRIAELRHELHGQETRLFDRCAKLEYEAQYIQELEVKIETVKAEIEELKGQV